MTRSIPEAAREIVRQFEGLRLTAYDDGVGIVTVGWGHVLPGGKIGDKITQRQADLFLTEDLQIAAKRIERKIGLVAGELSESQYAALLSFVFNLGVGGSSPEWKIWGCIRRYEFDAVPAQIQRFTRAGGKVLTGLVRRRSAEAALWVSGDMGPHEAVPASGVTRLIDTPPTSDEKPIAQSKTFWTGATVAVGGAVEGARQVQALVAPQADAAPFLAHLAQFVAVVIVAGGIAIMVFRWLDSRKRRA